MVAVEIALQQAVGVASSANSWTLMAVSTSGRRRRHRMEKVVISGINLQIKVLGIDEFLVRHLLSALFILCFFVMNYGYSIVVLNCANAKLVLCTSRRIGTAGGTYMASSVEGPVQLSVAAGGEAVKTGGLQQSCRCFQGPRIKPQMLTKQLRALYLEPDGPFSIFKAATNGG